MYYETTYTWVSDKDGPRIEFSGCQPGDLPRVFATFDECRDDMVAYYEAAAQRMLEIAEAMSTMPEAAVTYSKWVWQKGQPEPETKV